MQARVAISDTDLEERIAVLSAAVVKKANLRIVEKRVEMKKRLLAELARKAPKADPKKYGRDFPGTYEQKVRDGFHEKLDHEIPLGPLAGKALVLYDEKEATISELWKKGPGAEAGLEVGDRILKLNGKKYQP